MIKTDNIIELNTILAEVKRNTPAHSREYVRLIWGITNHVEITAEKGRESEIQILMALRRFKDELNKNYPIGTKSDTEVSMTRENAM